MGWFTNLFARKATPRKIAPKSGIPTATKTIAKRAPFGITEESDVKKIAATNPFARAWASKNGGCR